MNLYKKSLVNPYRNCFDTKKKTNQKEEESSYFEKK